jgi:aspartyl-tRNA(Asn)/glutamyl-tRNA(Gln) amidotransferase subunit A
MLHTYSLAELSQGLEKGDFTSVALTQHYLERIKQHQEMLNCYISVCEESALAQAAAADTTRARGAATPLTGIPIAQKDLLCTAGVKTSCGSKMLDNFIAPYDAAVIERCNAAGMVMLGKTNMDEFAMGSSNENSFHGPVMNPWDIERVPGGSSGGSAAAVAARLTPCATGTDTGGSIRQPAALTGITGLKPTYGRISRYGLIAYASSLDQAGPMTQTAEDAALLLNILAGHDPRDSTCMSNPVPDYQATLNQSIKGLTIGIPEEYFTAELNSQIGDTLQVAIKELQKLGANIKPIRLPNTHLGVPVYYVIAPAEASSNLSRYDGVRYGYRCENPKDLLDLYKRTRAEGFGEEVKRRILIGTYVLSAGYYDAYYIKAQKIRRLIRNDFIEAFKEVDVILGPTSPTTAFKLGEKTTDPISMYLSDIYTINVNLAGLPGLSLPAGFVDGLPVGMQLIGKDFDEATLLKVAHQYQQVSHWHREIPNMFKGAK